MTATRTHHQPIYLALLLLSVPSSVFFQNYNYSRTSNLTTSFAFVAIWIGLSFRARNWGLAAVNGGNGGGVGGVGEGTGSVLVSRFGGLDTKQAILAVGGWTMYSACARGVGLPNGVGLGSVLVPALSFAWKHVGNSGGLLAGLNDEGRGKAAILALGTLFGGIALHPWWLGPGSLGLAVSGGLFLTAALAGLEEGHREKGIGWVRNVVAAMAASHLGLWIVLGGLGASIGWFDLATFVTGILRLGVLILLASSYGSIHAGFLETVSAVVLSIWSGGWLSGLCAIFAIAAVVGFTMGGEAIMKHGTRSLGTVIGGTLIVIFLFASIRIATTQHYTTKLEPLTGTGAPHPVKVLIGEGLEKWENRQRKQSSTLGEAVAEYKRRYGIVPPPNFDKWFAFAKKNNVMLVDEFDEIHHALLPFWGMEPREIRKRVKETLGGVKANGMMGVLVRDGSIKETMGRGDKWQQDATREMVEKFVEFLPDMDLAFNIHDESRILIPDADMSHYLTQAAENRAKIAAAPRNQFSGFPSAEKGEIKPVAFSDFNVFSHQPIWLHARAACPPSSPARAVDYLTTKDAEEKIYTSDPIPFIQNHTAFQDVCLRPSLANTHGIFVRPNTYNVAQKLIPVFSQSKVTTFSDIIYPSPWYWADKAPYDSSRSVPWAKKMLSLYWRGSTTGSFSRDMSWKRSHRQIFIDNIRPANPAPYTILKKNEKRIWEAQETPRDQLSHLINTRFSHVGQCDEADCVAQKTYFGVAMRTDFQDSWMYKTLLDLDGNAFSGRFYAFLESAAVVLKMNLFQEWHDGWMVPWAHYIPVSGEGREVIEIMRWLEKEDGMAREMGERAALFRKRNLRKVDMAVWLGRLLLEYGRVIDDNRNEIGYDI